MDAASLRFQRPFGCPRERLLRARDDDMSPSNLGNRRSLFIDFLEELPEGVFELQQILLVIFDLSEGFIRQFKQQDNLLMLISPHQNTLDPRVTTQYLCLGPGWTVFDAVGAEDQIVVPTRMFPCSRACGMGYEEIPCGILRTIGIDMKNCLEGSARWVVGTDINSFIECLMAYPVRLGDLIRCSGFAVSDWSPFQVHIAYVNG